MLENKNIKLLIAGGCSFTQVGQSNFLINQETKELNRIHNVASEMVEEFNSDGSIITWPLALAHRLGTHAMFEGRGACGNGIISRSVIEAVEYALEYYKPEEILVGIMWSGRNRYEFYSSEKPPLSITKLEAYNQWYKNPMSIAGDSNYYLANIHWEDELTKYCYTMYDEIAATQRTLEHILRIQWYLKNLNIQYFMTEYHHDVIPKTETYTNNPDLKTLYKLLDTDKFLPCTDCYNWCKHNSGYPYIEKLGHHPSTKQHKEFVNRVIIPHLKVKKII